MAASRHEDADGGLPEEGRPRRRPDLTADLMPDRQDSLPISRGPNHRAAGTGSFFQQATIRRYLGLPGGGRACLGRRA